MKTEEGNKLIDDFMGLTQKDMSIVTTYKDPTGRKPILTEILGYHVSWDRLMPVVEKIEMTGVNVIIGYCTCEMSTFISGFNQTSVFPNKLDAVWNLVVQYIQWYTKIKK